MKYIYGITNSGNLSAYESEDWLINKSGFKQSQFQMSIYYNYAPDGKKIVVLSYVDGFVYVYTSESLEKWVVDTLGKRFHVKFLVF